VEERVPAGAMCGVARRVGWGDLRGLLKWVDDRFGLLDWWEEEGMVCFRTREKPAKA
jgi:hypothetical protein